MRPRSPALLPAALLLTTLALPACAPRGGLTVQAFQPAQGRPYSAATRAGDLYFLSGKVGATAETQRMTAGRTAAETRNIMEAFRTLLADLGLGFEDVVQATVYLADIADYQEMNDAYGAYFPTAPPARETVAVKQIVGNGAIEISLIAARRR